MPFWFEVIQKGSSSPELTDVVWLSRKSGVKPVFSWAINGKDRKVRMETIRDLNKDKMIYDLGIMNCSDVSCMQVTND